MTSLTFLIYLVVLCPQTSTSVKSQTTSQTEVTQTVMASVTKVTTREKVMMKYSKEKLPSSPPQKKRQIVVDAELQRRYVNFLISHETTATIIGGLKRVCISSISRALKSSVHFLLHYCILIDSWLTQQALIG